LAPILIFDILLSDPEAKVRAKSDLAYPEVDNTPPAIVQEPAVIGKYFVAVVLAVVNAPV